MEFDYEVTLSPDNNKKWQEMLSDSEGRKIMLEIYQLVVSNHRASVNAIIEKSYNSYKEGVLGKHFESFKELYSASEEMLNSKFEQ